DLIYKINEQFLKEIKTRFAGDPDRMTRMSLVQEGDAKRVRMAYLSIIGSRSVNGVSQLHTDLLKENLFKDFYELSPEKFNNKTNGITQRRWLLKSNPELSKLITESIGDKWVTHLEKLDGLQKYIDDAAFCDRWKKIKKQNKDSLTRYLAKTLHVGINPDSIFDIQVKRIHEYKRQLMFAFYVISQYLKIKNDPKQFRYPRTYMIGGKAAPGYAMAKLIIKFINNVAQIIENDDDVKDKMKLVFLENYRVSLAEKIFPASDVSEQISTAGMEASGTGNMKFMLNGALTIGTLDGANIEIHDQVGAENIFIFGLKAHEVLNLRNNKYDPKEFIKKSPVLKEILDLIKKNFFSKSESGIFEPILSNLTSNDYFMICADFDSYHETQGVLTDEFLNKETWTKKSIINVARSGLFSSDRTIREYAKDIWHVPTE
ncbi:MAG: glycogen/starch/alpha-glucan family phosphorylase, partial [Candidatus Omnitrophica bacterium]|nr:glycogen/starch/alpha-glucan family phosphorylase [Candidatus Omnitrophota bacterium]